VIQEVVSSTNVLVTCGRLYVPFRTISNFSLFLDHLLAPRMARISLGGAKYQLLTNVSNRLLPTTTTFITPCSTHETLFEQLLTLYKDDSVQASDPRDRIYAVLGLQVGSEELGLDVDYTKSWTLIYREWMEMCIEKIGVNILGYCHCAVEELEGGLASWVIDWTRPFAIPLHLIDDGPLFSASGSSPSYGQVNFLEPGVLRMTGLVVDTISLTTRAGKGRSSQWGPEYYAKIMADLELLAEPLAPRPSSKAEVTERVWRTASADCIRNPDGSFRRLKASDISSYDALNSVFLVGDLLTQVQKAILLPTNTEGLSIWRWMADGPSLRKRAISALVRKLASLGISFAFFWVRHRPTLCARCRTASIDLLEKRTYMGSWMGSFWKGDQNFVPLIWFET
jgi:hypothetical protein